MLGAQTTPENRVFLQFQQGGHVLMQDVPLRNVITWAYQLRLADEHLIGVPE
jgi:hypothetical protein